VGVSTAVAPLPFSKVENLCLQAFAGFKFFFKVNICLEGKTAGLHPK
jgi:hypothetical protein